jgi:hypothetical protein
MYKYISKKIDIQTCLPVQLWNSTRLYPYSKRHKCIHTESYRSIDITNLYIWIYIYIYRYRYRHEHTYTLTCIARHEYKYVNIHTHIHIYTHIYTCPVVEFDTAVPVFENMDFSSKLPETAPAAIIPPTVVIPVTLTPFLITVHQRDL